MPTNSQQGRFWLLTIPQHRFLPFLPPSCRYIKGQLECGRNTSYLHWQVFVCFEKKVRLRTVREQFGGECHAELSRSAAANEYVFKDDTAVENTRFELGSLPRGTKKRDWDEIWNKASSGDIMAIPPDVRLRYYSAIRRIGSDCVKPVAIERQVYVFWGRTGTGKSRRAWSEAGFDAYPKDPRTKFWDGYRGQTGVVMDEYRGGIDISHLLRWFDRYPVVVEIKGGATVLKAEKIWVTSNVDPRDWYPNLDSETKNALLRRLTITEFSI